MLISSFEITFALNAGEIEMKDECDEHVEYQKYRTVKQMLHESDISQFYNLGYDKEIIDGIFQIVKISKIDKQVASVMLKINFPQNTQLKEKIVNATSFLDEAISQGACNFHKILINERLYCILNGIHKIPNCRVCKNILKNFMVNRTSEIHRPVCSFKCSCHDKVKIEKQVKSYISRSLEDKLKTKIQTQNTIEQRFGNKCFMKTDYFKQKSLEYIKSNGGECNVSQIKEVRAKIDKTNEDTYGNRCNLANKDQLELKRQTYIKNYGVDHPMKNAEFKKHFFDEFEARHGYKFSFQSPQCIDKIHENRDNEHREIISKNEFVIPLFNLCNEHDLLCNKKQYWWQCLECGHCFAASILGYSRNDGRIVECPFCNMNNHISSHSFQELEIVDFLKHSFPDLKIFNSNTKVNRHIIPPYEIDIWIPEKKIGIEYNGSFWHSVEFLHKYREKRFSDFMFLSLKKKILCEQKNIHLIHLYEDEWTLNIEETKNLLIDLISQKPFTCQKQLDEIVIPYDKYSSFMQIEGYCLSNITQPTLQEHTNVKHKTYHMYDCGNLIFKQIM